MSIPTIAATEGGQRFHVHFSQVSVTSDAKYSIKIETSMPDLRLYYSDRIKYLGYNAPHTSPYLSGVAKLGSQEQDFSFKYALYEVGETSPPILSNVTATPLSETETEITFNANEPVDFRVEYGPDGMAYTQQTSFIDIYTPCVESVSLCSITIATIGGTQYEFRLTARDVWDNNIAVTGTFQTPGETPTPTPVQSGAPIPTPIPTDDTTSPIISNISIADIDDRSVKVAWHTDEAANSEFIVRLSYEAISIAAVTDSTFELEHVLEITDKLNPNTQYVGEIISFDPSNNMATSSIEFKTLAYVPSPSPTPTPSGEPPLTQTPTPSPSESPIVVDDDGNDVNVQWNPPIGNDPTGGFRIDIFDENHNLVQQVTVPANEYTATITGLSDGKHSVIVYKNNEGVFEKVAPPVTHDVGGPGWLLKLLMSVWTYIGLAIIIFTAVGITYLRKRKQHTHQTEHTPEENSSSTTQALK